MRGDTSTWHKDIRLSIAEAPGQTGKRMSENVGHLIAITVAISRPAGLRTRALLGSVSNY